MEQKAVYRARDAALSARHKLKAMGKESALPYGRALYGVTHQALAKHIAEALESYVLNPHTPRRFAAAMPFFDQFKGPDHIASVALTAALDNLTRKQSYATFCQQLGKAIEKENRLIALNHHSLSLIHI